jgi:hypothetical protein
MGTNPSHLSRMSSWNRYHIHAKSSSTDDMSGIELAVNNTLNQPFM